MKDSLETISLHPSDFYGMAMSKMIKIIFDLQQMSKLKVLHHHVHNTHHYISMIKEKLPHLNFQNDGPKKSTKWLHGWIWDMKAVQVNMFELTNPLLGCLFTMVLT